MATLSRTALAALVILLVGCERTYEDGRLVTIAASPCQCMMIDGCSATWSPKGNGLYADKTAPEDYHKGVYIGATSVPDQCRGVNGEP